MFFVPLVAPNIVSMRALLNVFPTVAEKSHICHRTVADQWLKTNWAQESSSRKEMLIWFMSVSQNILIRYFDWFDHKKNVFSSRLALGNVSFDDPKGVQTALTLSISLAESTYWQLRFKSKFHSSRLIQTKQYLSSTCTVHIVHIKAQRWLYRICFPTKYEFVPQQIWIWFSTNMKQALSKYVDYLFNLASVLFHFRRYELEQNKREKSEKCNFFFLLQNPVSLKTLWMIRRKESA